MTAAQRKKITRLVAKGWEWCGGDELHHDCHVMAWHFRTHRTYILVDRAGRVFKG